MDILAMRNKWNVQYVIQIVLLAMDLHKIIAQAVILALSEQVDHVNVKMDIMILGLELVHNALNIAVLAHKALQIVSLHYQ